MSGYAGPTCGMAADPQHSCGTTWLVDPAPLVCYPSTTLRPAKLHRCGLVGEHGGHLCPCGEMLLRAMAAADEDGAGKPIGEGEPA